TYEEEMVWTFRRRFGRLVAVGQPGERLPLPGAQRFYLPLHGWQPVVSELIGRARLVVLVAGTGPGTLWELTEAVRLLTPEQLLPLVMGDERAYRRFQEAVPGAFAERAQQLRAEGTEPVPAPVFPDYPSLHDPMFSGTLLGLQGIIHFDSAWVPTVTRVDVTAVRALTSTGRVLKTQRKQLRPVLTHVARRLPGEAPSRLTGGRRWLRGLRVGAPRGSVEGTDEEGLGSAARRD
ncbi:hypothetical protein ACWGJ2_40165, partial [Streptomyces sp. NPDC054796]